MATAPHIYFRDTGQGEGIDHDTLQRIAAELGTSEMAAVHIAINRLYFQLFAESEIKYPSKESVAAVNEAYGEHRDQTKSRKSLTDLF